MLFVYKTKSQIIKGFFFHTIKRRVKNPFSLTLSKNAKIDMLLATAFYIKRNNMSIYGVRSVVAQNSC